VISKDASIKDTISIIVPVYNTKDYLTECLSSLLNQSYSNLEIILVDDGSTDGSEIICDEFASKDARFKVIHTPNGGTSKARNIGMQYATGKYWNFIDSDDYVSSDFYERLIKELSDDVDIVSCGVDIVQPDGKVMRQSTPKEKMIYCNDEIVRELLINTTYFNFSMCNKLFRKELFEEIEFPIGKRHEEILVIYEIAKKCKKLICVDKAMYYYNVRLGSNSRHPFNLTNLQMSKATLEMYEDVKCNYPQYIDIALYRHLEYVMFLIEWIADAEEDYTDVRIDLEKHLRKYTDEIKANTFMGDDLKARMLLLAWKSENSIVNKMYERATKYLDITKIFDVWVSKIQKGKNIEEWFKRKNIHNIGIYGMSHLGQRLSDELKETSVSVKFVVDKNVKDTFTDMKIYSPEDEFENVELIVVTANFYFDEIKKIIEKKGDYKIISIKEIIMEF